MNHTSTPTKNGRNPSLKLAPKPLTADAMVLTADERELVGAFRRLSPDVAPIIFSFTLSQADKADAERKQRASQSRFRVVVGGAAS